MSKLKVNQVEAQTGTIVEIPGHVIQTVSASYSTAGSTTSTSATQMWSGASITPKSASSLIHVQVNWYAVHHDYYDGYIQLYKNGSAMTGQRIVVRNAAHTGTSFTSAASRPFWYCPAWLWNFTESAGGTSQITYSLYGWTQNASHSLEWNQAGSNNQVAPTSTMILTEIAQ